LFEIFKAAEVLKEWN